MIRVLVVDDEAPARSKVIRFLEADPDVTVVGQASNGREAVGAIRDAAPDLVYLDVQMPGMDGLEVARALEPPIPRIIFATAYDQYAIDAFEVHAFGYLLKPFDETRFARVLADAKRQIASERPPDISLLLEEIERRRPRRLLIQDKDRAFFLPAEKIDWVEAQRNYVAIHSGDRVHTSRGTVDALESKLDPAQFVRINRSNLVRIDFIRELRSWFHGEYKVVLESGATLTWTRRYISRRPELLGRI
jgi:two-component system LytT family response regulator